MRILGTVMCATAIYASIIFLAWIYIMVFDQTNTAYRYYVEPIEEYDYWVRKGFWEDLILFAIPSSFVICIAMVPMIARGSLFSESPSRRFNITLGFASSVLGVLPFFLVSAHIWSGGMKEPLGQASIILFLGCIYGVIVGFTRARRKSNTKTIANGHSLHSFLPSS